MQHADTTFDLIGLGFGPANIAIGGALVESWAGRGVRSVSYLISICPLTLPNRKIGF